MDTEDEGDDHSDPEPLVPEPSDEVFINSARSQSPWAWARAAQAAVQTAAPLLRTISRGPSGAALFLPRAPETSAVSEQPQPSDGDIDVPLVCGPSQLHMAVWLADIPRATELLQMRANPNEVDERGSTPLGLVVELYARSPEYEEVLNCLLENMADPRTRSAFGWSALDEAVSGGDVALVRKLFAHHQLGIRRHWEERLRAIVKCLEQLPDFSCTMRWEFESPLLPLLNKMLPSDVLRLWKSGSSLRLDSTLASWKKFRWNKRRNLTTLFSGADGEVLNLNHSKSTFVDARESLDNDEFEAIIEDLIQADPVQWDMKLDGVRATEATNWLGQSSACTMNGWSATRFDLQGSCDVNIRKKGTLRTGVTFEEYFGCPLPPDACPPEFRAQFRAASQGRCFGKESEWEDMSMASGELQRKILIDDDEPLADDDVDDKDMEEREESILLTSSAVPCREATGEESLLSGASSQQIKSFLRPSKSMGDLGPSPCPASKQYTVGANGGSDPSNGSAAPFGMRRLTPGQRLREQKAVARESKGRPLVPDRSKKIAKPLAASIWLASDFPIPMRQFMPVLEALSIEHEPIRKIKDYLGSHCLEEVLKAQAAASTSSAEGAQSGNVFPIKISMPVNMATRATIVFEAFELHAPRSIPLSLFQTPPEYEKVRRRDSQKTLGRKKKRMLLANLAL